MPCYYLPTPPQHQHPHPRHHAQAFYSSPHQSHRHASPSFQASNMYSRAQEDDEEELYLEYLDAARRQRERRDLEQVQARRWAKEEAVRVAQAKAYEEYQQYVHEQERRKVQAAALARAHAQAKAESDAREKARIQAILLAKAKAQYQAMAQRKAQEVAERERQQQLQEKAIKQHILNHAIRSAMLAAHSSAKEQPVQPVAITQAKSAPAIEARSTASQRPELIFDSFAAAVHYLQSQPAESAPAREALKHVDVIQARLSSAKAEYKAPEVLVFDPSATSPTPRLAYSSLNKPIQLYEETLTKLLIELDTIESNGYGSVKTARKQLAVAIEEELAKVESLKSAQFAKQHACESKKATVEANADSSATKDVDVTTMKSTESEDATGQVAYQTAEGQVTLNEESGDSEPSQANMKVPQEEQEQNQGYTVDTPLPKSVSEDVPSSSSFASTPEQPTAEGISSDLSTRQDVQEHVEAPVNVDNTVSTSIQPDPLLDSQDVVQVEEHRHPPSSNHGSPTVEDPSSHSSDNSSSNDETLHVHDTNKSKIGERKPDTPTSETVIPGLEPSVHETEEGGPRTVTVTEEEDEDLHTASSESSFEML